MRIDRIDFDDEEQPASITVKMSVQEAAVLYRFTGHVAPLFVTQAAGGDQQWGEASDRIAACLSSSFFNRFWENGINDVAPEFDVVAIAAKQAEYHA